MLCPNCSDKLASYYLDHQEVMHCDNCGGSFFRNNAINRITIKSAKYLRKKQDNILSQGPKICPIDKVEMKIITNSSAVPTGCILFECHKCTGVWSYFNDLVQFKKAQNAKIAYFKLWQIPLPSIKSVLLVSLFAVMSLTLFSQASSFLNTNLQKAKASDLINNISISQANSDILVTFRSQIPLTTTITLIDTNSGTKSEFIVSKEFLLVHFILIPNIETNENTVYFITGFGTDGKKHTTDTVPLTAQ